MPVALREMNMDFTRRIYEYRAENAWVRTAQKIATYTIIPLALIATFEAIVKNLLFIGTSNLLFTTYNQAAKCWEKSPTPATPIPAIQPVVEQAPAVPPPAAVALPAAPPLPAISPPAVQLQLPPRLPARPPELSGSETHVRVDSAEPGAFTVPNPPTGDRSQTVGHTTIPTWQRIVLAVVLPVMTFGTWALYRYNHRAEQNFYPTTLQ